MEKDQLKDFEFRIIVSGTRAFNDAVVFDEHLRLYLKDLGVGGENDKSRVCFMVGEYRTGVEKLLPEWCKKNGYAYVKFRPNWEDVDVEGAVVREKNGRQYNAVALVWANEEMAEVGSHLITFYDGVSSDTKDLMERMSEKLNPSRAVLVYIESDERESNHGRQS